MQELIRRSISRSEVKEKIGIMKTVLNEFKKFAMRGNVVDLAVGVIIGGAFNRIVTSLVNDVVMPPIGLLLGRVDFSNLYINLGDAEYETLAAAKEAGAPTINYGAFLNEVIGFVITAFVVFLLVRFINRLREGEEKEAEKAAPSTKECPYCRTQINLLAVRCPACTSGLDK